MNIFCAGFPYSLEENQLREIFEPYGVVDSVKIITDKESGRSKGFGFVEMGEDSQAKEAINALNGMQVGGRSIAVSQAQERQDKRPGGGGFSRGGGGYNKGGSGGYNKGRESEY